MSDGERTKKIPSNYVAVTALEGSDQFAVLLPGEQGLLRTPAGHLVHSGNYKLLSHLVRELEEHPVLHVADGIIVEPRPLCTYLLYATEKDFLEPNGVMGREQVEHALKRDPVLHPSAGPEWTDQLRAWESLDAFLGSLGAELHPQVSYSDDRWGALVDAITARWSKLSPMGKSVVINLHALTEGNLIAALALASGACSDIEFGHAVLAGSPLHHTFGFPIDEMTPEEQHGAAYRQYRDLARVCVDYLSFFPTDTIALIVDAGESSSVEFKSSLRWDIRNQKRNDDITYASLKTLAAFLNTDGGTLLLGVADDGSAVGIEVDGFSNDDKFLLHLYAVIKSSMGTDVTPLIQADIDMYDGRKVCRVRCKRSPRPVYLKAKATDEDFYIRTGPSSERLKPSDLVRYISSERFRGQ